MNRNLKVNQKIRALQDRYQAERPDSMCVWHPEYCGHTHPAIDLPAGVHPIPVLDFSGPETVTRVILVRYTRRQYGGWNVVRADNGRHLGWVFHHEIGESKGKWGGLPESAAFRGDGPDDTGSVMDYVPTHLHRSPDGNPLKSGEVSLDNTRSGAAEGLVSYLVQEHAPATGFGHHWSVTDYHTRPAQHIVIGDACTCGEPVPCPRKAALIAQGR